MWRPLVMLGLLAAVAGPLMRQAEAADDLARTLIALLSPCGIEPYDSGVGDEPELGAVKSTAAIALEAPAAAELHFAQPALSPNLPGRPAPLFSPRLLHEPPRAHAERLARLQLLLV